MPTVRLIDDNDAQLGVVDVRDAIQKARDAGMDLVEVAPQSVPPVCRIMDYGKWMYSQRKKEQKAKSHRHETELKEIRIRTPKIGDHDLDIKLVHARDFLGRGDRVQFSLRFRGRELAHIDEGRKIFDHIKHGLEDISRVDQDFRFEGRRLTMTPAGAKKPPEKPGEKPAAKPAGRQPGPAGRSSQPAAPRRPSRPGPLPRPRSRSRRTKSPPADGDWLRVGVLLADLVPVPIWAGPVVLLRHFPRHRRQSPLHGRRVCYNGLYLYPLRGRE